MSMAPQNKIYLYSIGQFFWTISNSDLRRVRALAGGNTRNLNRELDV